MWKAALISVAMAAMMPTSAYSQCARMVGSNQIICPGYANSTVPVYTGPGGNRPGPGAIGAGTTAVGVVTTGLNVYRRNSQGLPYTTGTIARGYQQMTTQPWVVYQPRMAYPARRPSNYPW